MRTVEQRLKTDTAYIRYPRKSIRISAVSPESLQEAHLRKTREESDRIEMENAIRRGELVDAETVFKLGASVFTNAKQQIFNSHLSPEEQDALLEELASLGGEG